MLAARLLPLLVALVLTGCDGLDPGRVEAERAVKRLLLDPDSAQFTGVHRRPESGAYCGFVNAKNRMGGYAGKRLFAFKDQTVLLTPKEEDIKPTLDWIKNAQRRVDAGGMSLKELEELQSENERKAEELAHFRKVADTVHAWCYSIGQEN